MNLEGDEMKVKYDEIIKKQLKEGIIEITDSSENYLQQDHVVTHYLTHHAVENKKKLRIVYKGCAKTHSSKRSLNECISREPNMATKLGGNLLRFRLKSRGICRCCYRCYVTTPKFV